MLDVAAAVAQALAVSVAKGQVYELGGPRIYTYKALVQLVLAHIQRRRLLIRFPSGVWELLAAVLAPLPNRPISRDQITLMKRDNLVGANDSLSPSSVSPRPRSKTSCPATWDHALLAHPPDQKRAAVGAKTTCA